MLRLNRTYRIMYTFIVNVLILSLTCFNSSCHTLNKQVRESIPTEVGIDSSYTDQKEVDPDPPGNNNSESYHYVALCKFTKQSLEIISVKKQAGEMNLIVSSASELFLAGFVNNQLVHYYRFADPLESHGIDQESNPNKLNAAEAFILFPKSLENYLNNKSYFSAIYRVDSYINSFAEQIGTATSIKQAISDHKLTKIYELNLYRMSALIK